MTIKGIDVSSHQSGNYSTRGMDFVFVKASEGRSYVNPKQGDQAAHGREAGLVLGFYHFLWPGNIKTQAQYFVDKAKEKPGDMLACDWEHTSEGTAASNKEKDAFIKEVKRLRPRHKVLLYCNRDFWLNRDTTSYAGDGLWIAQYNGKPGKPDIQASWRFHQYTSSPIDTNVGRFSSRSALRSWARERFDAKLTADGTEAGEPAGTAAGGGAEDRE
ncbi:muramidase [Streptomyces sp. CNQ-509]|uniref:glycoside hydrolase family 25 protein n=1 Tax=Streptomyces sp. CNQ-509 TaxID=444103 RepID=UPI00062DE45A|nr:glycoside hydrolase family 25 protein [Streptomyces sp. CNQ-509]AKH82186.1 muramidase [Streptomyces sp. CNQ-509]